MSDDQSSLDGWISRLSHERHHKSMITIPESVNPSTIKRDPKSSSVGLLDILPAELLQCTLSMLDFQSQSRVSRVSLRGNAVVQSLPAFRDPMKYAPQILSALSQTELFSVHSSNALYAALLSDKCPSCGEYGAFLFLPTCERCCYKRLSQNQSLWVIPTAHAKKCFDLTERQIKQVPIMRSIPGRYGVRLPISRKGSLRLVSVKLAKELGISIHGSVEDMAGALAAKRKKGVIKRQFRKFRFYQDAPLEPLPRDPSTQPPRANVRHDYYCGMASISFPSLPFQQAIVLKTEFSAQGANRHSSGTASQG